MKKRHFFKVALALLTIINISGCGDEGSQANNSPSVQYGEDSSGDNDITKYTNADWLYQNYFGEYGLPDELKTMMMPELKMLANGFALQHSRGENVGESISQFNTAMQMLYSSGEMGKSMSQMVAENDEGAYDVTPEEDHEPVVEERVLSEESQENVAEADRLEEEHIREQEQLVADHNLPYALPGKTNKYVIYNQSMKYSTGKNSTRPEPNKHRGLDAWNWWLADIIWSNGAKGIGHMGLITRTFPSVFVVDANTGPGVVRHKRGATNWANDGGWSRVEGLYYSRWSVKDYRRYWVANHADRAVGRPYNWYFWNKHATTRTYCSQLVWQAFKSRGVDLDRNGGLIVWPNDIRYHRDIIRKFESSIL